MIPDEVRVVGLAFLGQGVRIEVDNGHSVGVKSPDRNIFLFQGIVSHLYALVSAHTVHSLDRLDHFKDELCADLEALAELIAVGEVV